MKVYTETNSSGQCVMEQRRIDVMTTNDDDDDHDDENDDCITQINAKCKQKREKNKWKVEYPEHTPKKQLKIQS